MAAEAAADVVIVFLVSGVCCNASNC